MRRKTIVITSALAFSLLLSGCGAGQNAATRTITRVTDGTEVTVKENGSEIRIVNLTLVDTEDGAAVIVATIGAFVVLVYTSVMFAAEATALGLPAGTLVALLETTV